MKIAVAEQPGHGTVQYQSHRGLRWLSEIARPGEQPVQGLLVGLRVTTLGGPLLVSPQHIALPVNRRELIELADGAEHVVTVADFGGAREHGVTFSSGQTGRAVHALGEIGELIESGRFSLTVAQTFPLAEVAEAHRVSEQGHVRGKLVLLVG